MVCLLFQEIASVVFGVIWDPCHSILPMWTDLSRLHGTLLFGSWSSIIVTVWRFCPGRLTKSSHKAFHTIIFTSVVKALQILGDVTKLIRKGNRQDYRNTWPRWKHQATSNRTELVQRMLFEKPWSDHIVCCNECEDRWGFKRKSH